MLCSSSDMSKVGKITSWYFVDWMYSDLLEWVLHSSCVLACCSCSQCPQKWECFLQGHKPVS